MSRYTLLFLAMVLTSLFACKNEPASPASSNLVNGAVQQTDPDMIGDSLIFFSCNDITQPGDKLSHYEVFVHIATNKAKVGEIEDCTVIAPEKYADYQIDAGAISAIGYDEQVIYVIRTETSKVVVRLGMADGNGGYRYRAVSSFTTTEMSSNRSINQVQLVGTYSGKIESENQSYLLFLGLSNKVLTAQLFRVPGEIPQQDQLIVAMQSAEPELLRNFIVNMSDLTFESSTGSGKFIPGENNEMQVQFDAILGPNKQPLILNRMQMVPEQ
ncbi:MAG: hypothetical protein KDC34_05395 [Saprospiraceae bacterium]|nr:hypothetical protein [Saprospiraceae bacterium]